MKFLIEGGIPHLEDLSIEEFIEVLQNLTSLTGVEKLDGAQLWLGVDEEGRFFTSREGKRQNSDRMYKVDDWPKVSAFNQFRAAHAALQQKEQLIKQVLQPGDTIEAEVIFGKQPNSVMYGANERSYVAFLRGVNGTADTLADQLGAVLSGQEAQVSVDLLDTDDGETLNDVNTNVVFQFIAPQKIDSTKLRVPELSGDLEKLMSFLKGRSPVQGKTNLELMTVSLTSVPKEQRAEVKQARADVLAKVQTEYKIPIKQLLLDKIVRNVRSPLTDTNTPDEDDVGIEGIVLRNPSTGEQIKLVDKDIFTTVNQFNQSVRGQIQSSLHTVDPDSDIETRGGLLGVLRIKLAELLGNRELARGAAVRKAMEPLKGNSPEEAIKNFAASMNGIDDYQMLKKNAMAVMSETARELKDKLADFKQNQKNYRLKLKNGKEIGLSQDTVKRTLLTFAEARRNLETMFDKVKRTESLAQFLAILYGGQAHALFNQPDETVTESLMESRKGEVDQADYQGKSAYQLMNTYVAIVLTSFLIYHEHDTIGMRLLRDRPNYLMKKWVRTMSPLNHWGYVIWRNARPDMKKQLSPQVREQLNRGSKRIPAQWVRDLHQSLSWNHDTKMDLVEHKRTLHRLLDMSGLRSERLNTLIDAMISWPDLTYDEKVKSIGALFMLSQQFATSSTLFVRLRVIQSNLLLNATGLNTQMIEGALLKSIQLLAEDGEADPGAGATSAAITTSAAIAPVPQRLGGPHKTVMRRRNPKVKGMMMKFPDTRKTTE
jgi:hypothetical protein